MVSVAPAVQPRVDADAPAPHKPHPSLQGLEHQLSPCVPILVPRAVWSPLSWWLSVWMDEQRRVIKYTI